jgi:hypothetical protein
MSSVLANLSNSEFVVGAAGRGILSAVFQVIGWSIVGLMKL